jgi:hypothetical protein
LESWVRSQATVFLSWSHEFDPKLQFFLSWSHEFDPKLQVFLKLESWVRSQATVFLSWSHEFDPKLQFFFKLESWIRSQATGFLSCPFSVRAGIFCFRLFYESITFRWVIAAPPTHQSYRFSQYRGIAQNNL